MIVVVGEALIDLVIGLDGQLAAAPGGAPYNTARAAARLGASTSFVGRLADDRFGRRLTTVLEVDGVAIDRAPVTSDPTTLAAAELDGHGSATYRFYFAGTSAPGLVDGDLDPVLAALRAAAHPAFFTGGLALVLTPMADTVASAVAALDDRTICVVDVNCRPDVIDDRDAYLRRLDDVLARADLVKVSDDDLDYLSPGLGVDESVRLLLDRGVRAVLVTAGSNATSVVTAAGRRDIPVAALSGPVVDTIGAGDTFGGGVLAWWAIRGLGRDDLDLDRLADAVAAAHAAAAIVVTRRGADPPWRHDLPADWV